jgi:diguanylate cyclase (GGDEF)-like protein
MRLSGSRILLVEDSDFAAAVTSDALDAAGYRVRRVRDGAEALRALADNEFEIVVTDAVMPNLNGFDLCRALRNDPASAGLYVLTLTSLDRKRDIVDGLAAGADDYLVKPFDDAELLARVRAGLRIVGLQRDLTAANEALSHLALTDPLTELPNRRAFDQMLVTEAAYILRGGADGVVVMVDLDNFKAINDDHGHEVGDLALVAAARILRRSSRLADTCARVGGEEFALLLRGTNLDNAVALCERIRRDISTIRIGAPDASELSFTASFGVASLNAELQPGDAARSTQQLAQASAAARAARAALRRADTALYRAKAAGKNRVHADDAAR